jgi:hypothetical protein
MTIFGTDGTPGLRLGENGDRSGDTLFIDPSILRNIRSILNDRYLPVRAREGKHPPVDVREPDGRNSSE